MALHLSGLIKTKHMVFGSSFVSHPVFGEREEKKMRKPRVCKEEWLGLALLPIYCS